MVYRSRSSRLTPMDEVKLVGGDLFAFGLGPGSMGSIWLVARALDSEMVPKDDSNWASITGGNAAGPLRSDGTTAGSVPDLVYLLTAEATERSWLYHEQKNEFWQIFATLDRPLYYVYREYPKGNRMGPLGAADVPGLAATAISTWGWTWSGWESFGSNPTLASMFLLPYKVNVAHAIYNIASYAKTPRVQWHLNEVQFDPLDPRDKDDARLIQDVLRSRIEPKVRWSPGIKGFSYKPGFQKVFGVPPVIQTKREFMIQPGGAGGELIPMEV